MRIPVVENILQGSLIFLTSPIVLVLKVSAVATTKDLAPIILDSRLVVPMGFDNARSKQVAVLASMKSNATD